MYDKAPVLEILRQLHAATSTILQRFKPVASVDDFTSSLASQGATIEEARANLREALELFFETASPEEIQTRMHEEVYVTRLEVALGKK
jgi:predicted RNase H-like HicB family nuclease